MRRLTVPAPAKLNLFLHVTGRRDDGYHLLETLLVALDVGDTITLTCRDDGAIARTTELRGVAPQDADAFIARMRRDYGFAIEGLMCIPPAEEPAGPHFALLAKIAARNGIAKLSMGMSADYETAVMFGATSVRVGSALFGARG